MATIRSYNSPKASPHLSAHTHVLASSPLSSSIKSTLPLPKAIRENRSFANLARLLGLAHGDDSRDHEQEDGSLGLDDEYDGEMEEEEDADGEGSEVVDEESLMWDAQTALIAHQPAIAIKYYTMAALPPHRSAPACLALGNLLARGSSLLQPESPSTSVPSRVKRDSRDSRSSEQSDKTVTSTAARIRGIFFSSPPVTPTVASSSPTDRTQQRPVVVGWGIPRHGNRAVRDVEGMGLASAWLVLGLGWIVESEESESSQTPPAYTPGPTSEQRKSVKQEMKHITDEDALVLPSRSRTSRSNTSSTDISRTASDQRQQSSPELSHASSDQTDSTVLRTPYAEDGPSRGEPKERPEYEQLKLMYDLLSPLVALYRHGQIQEHDPVALPPITPAQLPTCLQPQGDLEKRRNAWQLGAVVANALMELGILNTGSMRKGKGKEGGKVEKRRQGVSIMVNYLLGMTRPEPESYFRRIVHLGQCGLEMSDELVEQAASRLDTIMRSTPTIMSPMSPAGEYPFPRIPRVPSTAAVSGNTAQNGSRRVRGHSRISSIASNTSFMSTISARILPSMKSSASIASMAEHRGVGPVYRHGPDLPPLPTNQTLAMDSLRRIRASSARPADVVNASGPGSWWPSLSIWGLASARSQSGDGDDQDGSRSTLPRINERSDGRTPILRPTQSTLLPSSRNLASELKHKTSASLSTNAEAKSTTLARPELRPTASSPNISNDNDNVNIHVKVKSPTHPSGSGSGPGSGHCTPPIRRKSPLEPSETDSINTIIDPELAAAELRSALTKKVVCGVCGIQGVNFPNCRKCEMTFCSRSCRVDEKKGGDGKRHVCGAWESRKFLTVPTPSTRSRRKSKSISRPSPLTIKA